MPMLLLATNNPGKVDEIRSLLTDLPVELVTPAQVGLNFEVLEDGQTYAENAARKAMAFNRASGLVTLADDSGLEVDALGGQPGLRSHRFAPWPDATDADRRTYLLQQLHERPRPWKAHFHCTIAIATRDGLVIYADGECAGEIIPDERGSNGFGYDPIFYFPDRRATMAELEPEVKNQISHRARAILAALPALLEITRQSSELW
jgi:XTP/dITP diphosphohydrolase